MFELNKIYLEDVIKFLHKLDDNSIDVIIADPPFYRVLDKSVVWDHQWKSKEEFLLWCKSWMIECKRVLKNTGSLFVFCGLGRYSDSLIYFKLLLDELELQMQDFITFKKCRGNGNRRGFLYIREEILWYSKTDDYIWNEENQYSEQKRLFTVTNSANKSKFKRLTNIITDIVEVGYSDSVHNYSKIRKELEHKSPKPIKLMERFIKCTTYPGDLVVDLFTGTGAGVFASKNTNRNFLACDSDKKCIDKINMKLKQGAQQNRLF